MSKAGFTLIEVVLTLLIIATGVLAVAESLTRLVRLTAAGRERGRVAVVLESRLDWLRSEARQAGCAVPAGGTARSGEGIVESWTARPVGSSIEALVIARGPGRSSPDTLLVRFPCL